MLDLILLELNSSLPDAQEAIRVTIRLVAAMLLGAVIGIQRERTGKPAGFKTHILVALGSALFILAPLELEMGADAASRVIQGLVAGIGFLGAGAILKLHATREIEGLTTAAGIWMTAAVGVAAGLGRLGLAALSVLLAWITLSVLARLENLAHSRKSKSLIRTADAEPRDANAGP
jgi:putative Mg2+ transporter-C (MgtC) family protein